MNVLDAVAQFHAERVFGSERQALLAADLAHVDNHAFEQRDAECERLTSNVRK